MSQEFNLLGQLPKIMRDTRARNKNKEISRELALKFGREYFDGTREQGYGGYNYDGRWRAIAKRAIEFWSLKPGDRVLDIGCAKGYFVKDLCDALPGLEVFGIDVSDYALSKAHPVSKPYLIRASCEKLPFPDKSFAAAFAINTIHNLERKKCFNAIQEIERICPGRGFIQVDAYRTESERNIFLEWMLTAKTFDTPSGWQKIFADAGFSGNYWWTILSEGNNN